LATLAVQCHTPKATISTVWETAIETIEARL
jgi:hypothetical protein